MRLLLPEQRPLTATDLLELYGSDQPGLRAGFVLSVDGRAALQGSSRPLQTPSDQAVFHALRAVTDAVLVGAGTARHERYRSVRPRPDGLDWRSRRGLPERPSLVVVSRSANRHGLPAPEQAILVTCAAAGPVDDWPGAVVAGQDEVDLSSALGQLRARGLRHLLCEGGPALLTSLLGAGLVDELCLTTAPLVAGAGIGLTHALPHPQPLLLRHLVDGEDGSLLARYAVQRS